MVANTALMAAAPRRRVAAAAAFAVLLAAAACDRGTPTTAGVSASTTSTTPTSSSSTTSNSSTTTTATVATSSTTVQPPPTTNTTTTSPPLSNPGRDTGYTRVRFVVDTQAAWVTTILHGGTIHLAQVVETTGAAHVTSLGPSIAVHNPGRAVVDVALSVTDGAQPVLSMCKNYLGPATVTLTRLTDGATEIVALHNPGLDASPPAGECENYLETPVARSALMGPVRWPARVEPRPLVLANYYPWYDAASLVHDFGPDNPVGPANTNDPVHVQEAVDRASAAGIDGFVVEYEGAPTHDPRVDMVYETADRHGAFQVSLMLDFPLLAKRYGSTDALLDGALAAMARRATHPSQLEVAGEPVVFVYGGWSLDTAQWNAALARLRASTGVSPFVVADAAHLGSPAQYLYGTYRLPTPDHLAQWADGMVLDLRLRPALNGQTGPVWVAPVSPGYDDRRLGRRSPLYVDRRGGVRYDETWEAALASLPDWILITTWNEYHEQTHIMPGTATGWRALDQTRTWAERFHEDG